jgi:glutamate-ammonia-ligase adenylyltransferase
MIESERIKESSQYLATLLRRREDYGAWLFDEKNLHRRYALTALYEDLQKTAEAAATFDELLAAFREFKQRHFLRIGGRDLLGLADLSETTSQLSELACVALQVGLDMLSRHWEWWCGEEEAAQLREVIGKTLDLVVIGLGKLGGQELNYVSDIDIIFIYSQRSEDGHLQCEGVPALSLLCQRLTRLLSEKVEGDQVFLVDLRLRPQGKDGLLVPSLSSASEYYLQCGKPWERQMLLKARPVAGARSLGAALLQEVRPFVFRRFLDFQALDELRVMRDRIIAEAVHPREGWEQFDVKLGVGGIREVEFFVQSLQLIYGGRQPELDEPNTLRCLDRLVDLELVSARTAKSLGESYIFLRRVEHWVQLDQNRRTQKLPRSEGARTRLAAALGFQGDYDRFLGELDRCCASVHDQFMDLFSSRSRDEDRAAAPDSTRSDDAGKVDLDAIYPSEPLTRLKAHLGSFSSPVSASVLAVLEDHSNARNSELLEKIVIRLERYFGNVRKRPGLVKAFEAAGSWLGDFCRGLAKSELLSDLMSHNPSLVEGIMATSGACPDTDSWMEKSRRLLERADGYEEKLEWLRRLKNERLLQLVLADLRGDVNSGEIEVELTGLADFVIECTYLGIEKNLSLDHALPLAVFSLGKLGSREMSYLSDLDLVFVYKPRPEESSERIPTDVVRFAQRLMRMLSTPFHEGPGYAVDARLRPSGNYGPLIVTDKTWIEYYTTQADIWEIQALLRIRFIAGDRGLGQWIMDKARDICYRRRKPSDVWQRLCHLRGRMQRERAEEKADAIDIKLGMGGLADLEFLVQGQQLIQGYGDPTLQQPSVRSALPKIFQSIPELEARGLEAREAFTSLRSLEHRVRLLTNSTSSRLSPSLFGTLGEIGLWPCKAASNSLEDWPDLLRLRRRIRSMLQPFCPDLS